MTDKIISLPLPFFARIPGWSKYEIRFGAVQPARDAFQTVRDPFPRYYLGRAENAPYLAYANLDPRDEEAIIGFANTYGLPLENRKRRLAETRLQKTLLDLAETYGLKGYRPDFIEQARKAEIPPVYVGEVLHESLKMRHLVTIWKSFREGDYRALKAALLSLCEIDIAIVDPTTEDPAALRDFARTTLAHHVDNALANVSPGLWICTGQEKYYADYQLVIESDAPNYLADGRIETENLTEALRFKDGQPILEWRIQDTLEALYLMFVMDIVSDSPIKKCGRAGCENFFIARSRADKKFCSLRCSRAVAQREFRKRVKTQKRRNT